jgi:hypothetical protein
VEHLGQEPREFRRAEAVITRALAISFETPVSPVEKGGGLRQESAFGKGYFKVIYLPHPLYPPLLESERRGGLIYVRRALPL